jgi:hypothetical protein
MSAFRVPAMTADGRSGAMKRSAFCVLLCLTLLAPLAARADDAWIVTGADGQPQVQLYFFWSLTCPHCTAAHPYIEAIPQARPWVKLHALELSRHPENVQEYEAMARATRRRGGQCSGMAVLRRNACRLG